MNDAVLVRIREMSAALARTREWRTEPACDPAHHSFSHAYICSLLSQAVAANAFVWNNIDQLLSSSRCNQGTQGRWGTLC